MLLSRKDLKKLSQTDNAQTDLFNWRGENVLSHVLSSVSFIWLSYFALAPEITPVLWMTEVGATWTWQIDWQWT